VPSLAISGSAAQGLSPRRRCLLIWRRCGRFCGGCRACLRGASRRVELGARGTVRGGGGRGSQGCDDCGSPAVAAPRGGATARGCRDARRRRGRAPPHRGGGSSLDGGGSGEDAFPSERLPVLRGNVETAERPFDALHSDANMVLRPLAKRRQALESAVARLDARAREGKRRQPWSRPRGVWPPSVFGRRKAKRDCTRRRHPRSARPSRCWSANGPRPGRSCVHSPRGKRSYVGSYRLWSTGRQLQRRRPRRPSAVRSVWRRRFPC